MSAKCVFIIIVALIVVLTGSLTASTVVKPGDTLSLLVAGEEDVSKTYVVDQNGAIDIPGMGSTVVAGKTIEQAQQSVTAFLKGFFKSPDVRLSVSKPKGIKITVNGDVQSPGKSFEAYEQIGLKEAIAFAGGTTATSDLTQISIVRDGKLIKADLSKILADVDPNADIKLEDGDIITVPSRRIGEFTVLGAVKSAGTYTLLRGMRLLDAVKAAGGPADGSKVEVVKIVHSDQTEERANYGRLLTAGAIEENKVIHPGDTVVLESGVEGLSQYSVMGAVLKPGRFDLTQRMTIAEAIAQCGGFAANAKREACSLHRKNPDGSYTKTVLNFKDGLGPNIYVQDGDIIDVPDRVPKKSALDAANSLLPFLWLLL